MITSKTMAFVLGISEMAFTSAKVEEDILAPLTLYSYDKAKLDWCMSIHDKAKKDYQYQIVQYSEQYQATKALEEAYDEANGDYIEHITLTRLALKHDRSKWTKFGLNGKRKKDIFGWLEQGELYYDGMLSDQEVIALVTEKFALTLEKLENAKAKLLKVKEANRNRQKEKAEAQQATVDRNESFKVLYHTLSDFFQACRFALAPTPQLLEKVGILKLSEGYRRQLKDELEDPAPEEIPTEETTTEGTEATTAATEAATTGEESQESPAL